MGINRIYCKKIIYGLLLLFWMGVIFYLSSRTGDESSSTSTGITHFVSELAVRSGVINEKDITPNMLSIIHKWIRIFAHFFEYTILGIISFQFFKQFQLKRIINVALFSLLFCIAYAISDEIHQYFVPGRAMDILDVITDTLGSITGISLMLLKSKLTTKSISNRHQN